MNHRLAAEQDFPRLAEMRWDFRTEYKPPVGGCPKPNSFPPLSTFYTRDRPAGNGLIGWLRWKI